MKRILNLTAGFIVPGAVTAMILLAGCGGPPAIVPLLEEARVAYQEAAADSQVVAHAPVALQEAEEELQRSEQLWRKDKDRELIEHHAYLARQRVRIARQTAALNAAQEEVKQAQVVQKEVQLQARTREAELAQKKAEQARLQAERAQQTAEEQRQAAEAARREAEAALARLQEMTQRVHDLEAEQTARGLVLTLGDVLFDVDKAHLKPGGARVVDDLAAFLKDYPERNVLIEGFTDDTGSDEHNLELSRNRAGSVQTALIERGIDPMRIRTQGYGEAFPVATNGTAAGRQRNRRVEVVISDKKGQIPARNAENSQ